jgi:hypothetical protein
MEASEALKAWADYSEYGRLKTAKPTKATDNPEGFDYGLVIWQHVERFWSMVAKEQDHGAYRALVKHHFLGLPVAGFKWREPVATQSMSLLRIGWYRHLGEPCIPTSALQYILGQFRAWYKLNPVPDHITILPDWGLTKAQEKAIDAELRSQKEIGVAVAASMLRMNETAVCNLFARGHIFAWKHRRKWVTTIGRVEEFRDAVKEAS